MKWIIVVALVGIVVALGSAGVLMVRKPGASSNTHRAKSAMARALAVRVGISVALFIVLIVAWRMGWITPSGIPMGR
jgi:hypothetical protein